MIYPTFDFEKKQCQHFAESLKINSEKKAYFQQCLNDFEYNYLSEDFGGSTATIIGQLAEKGFRDGRFKNLEKEPFYIWCKKQIENLTNELEADQLSDVPSAEVTGQSENSEMPQSKIQWNGKRSDLAAVINILEKKGCFDEKPRELNGLISQHFAWKNDNNEYEKINPQWLSDLRGEEAGSSTNQTLENASEIKWRGNKTDFAGLINVLEENGCLKIGRRKINKLISEHFMWEDENGDSVDVNPKGLADLRGKVKSSAANNTMDVNLESQLNDLLK